MRPFRLAYLLTGSAVLVLAAPAMAQEPSPIVVPVPDGVPANQLRPPLVVPTDESPAETIEPPAPPIPAVWAPVPVDMEGQSAYGLYLAGRLASIRGDRS